MRLTILEHLYQHAGPYTSVYLDTSRDSEQARHKIAVRWKDAARSLKDQGAPQADIDAIGALLTDAVGATQPEVLGVGPTGHAIFATGGTVLLAAELEGPPRRDTQRFAPLPHAMPFVAQARETVPHVLVLADRTGADIIAVGNDGDSLRRELEGSHWPIRKVQAGGWSHRRYQQAAEETWEHNAALVAAAATEAAKAVRAEVVLVSGEERARSLVAGAFGGDLRADVVEVPGGGRAPGIDEDAFQAEVAKLLGDRVAVRVATLAARYREELGQLDKATAGLAATIAALRLSQAEVVFVNDDPAADRTLFIGPEPVHVGLTKDEVLAMGVPEPVKDRVDAALVRAAAASGAEIVVVPTEELALRDGIGALLRYRLS